MGDVYDTAFFGTEKYEFMKGREAYRDRLYAYFPDEKPQIAAYCELLFRLQKKSILFHAWKVLPRFLRPFMARFFRGPYLKYAGVTTAEVLESF